MAPPAKAFSGRRLLCVSARDSGDRLDRWLAGQDLGVSRAQVQRWIEDGLVEVNGTPARKRAILKSGDHVEIRAPGADRRASEARPPVLEVLFEDDHVLVVNKPPMVVVHPARSGQGGTLVDALREYTDRLSAVGGADRPGIVHRLDRGTSGILVVARTDEAHRGLARQFKARTVEKRYRALVWGSLACEEGTVSAPLGRHRWQRKRMAVRCEGGREADTRYEVGERLGPADLLWLRPGSGRTHQLRVHLAYIGHPIVGDPEYGGRRIPAWVPSGDRRRLAELLRRLPRQALHAEALAFDHPIEAGRCRFEAPAPQDMTTVEDGLRTLATGRSAGNGGGRG